jgi:hypothetical protein
MPEFAVDSILAGLGVFVVVAFGLVMLDAIALALGERGARGEAPHPSLSHAVKLRRLAVVAIVMAVIAAAGAGLQVIGGNPLRAAGPPSGSGSLYLGTAPTVFGGIDDIVFQTVAGGDIQMDFSLVNTGEFPVTITGMNEPLNGSPMWEIDGYFASGSVVPEGQPNDGITHRFEIQPHSAVPVVAHLRVRKCTPTASASPAPEQTPSAWAAVAAEAGGFVSLGSLSIVYEMLGQTRTTTLVLPANLVLIDANSVLCPGDGGAPPTNYP